MHKEAIGLDSQHKLMTGFQIASNKAKALTLNFFRYCYSSIRMGLSYRQLIGFISTLKESGFEVGNRNNDEEAAQRMANGLLSTMPASLTNGAIIHTNYAWTTALFDFSAK